MGKQVTGTSDLFIKYLKEKGFTEISSFKTSYRLCGVFANEVVDLTVLATPTTNTVCKIIVYFSQKNNWEELKRDYFSKKILYSKKYVLTDSYSFFSDPYDEGDGYELIAVKNDKSHFISFFDAIGGTIGVEIESSCRVVVKYEDKQNMKLAEDELNYEIAKDI